MTYPPKKSRTNLFAVLGIAAVLVVAGVVAIVVTTGRDDGTPTRGKPTASAADTRLAAQRDAAVADGTRIAAVFTTLDYETVDSDLDRWESSATGALLDQLKSGREQSANAVTQARSKSKGTVLSAALAEFDPDKGTARLLAAVDVEIAVDVAAGGQPSRKRQRLSVALERTADGWKASALTTV
jgi:Mce-associated membrane protein